MEVEVTHLIRMTYLVVIVDFVAFKKGFFMSSYTDNLKQENDQLKKELAELKANIPQIKHDVIMSVVDYAEREDILFLSDSDIKRCAKSLLAQAKEQSE